jgi:hypothetical protein
MPDDHGPPEGRRHTDVLGRAEGHHAETLATLHPTVIVWLKPEAARSSSQTPNAGQCL